MVKLRVKRGDTWIFTAKWSDGNGNPIDLDGCLVRQSLTLENSNTAVLTVSTASGELTLVEDADEEVGLLCNVLTRVEAEDMESLVPGWYEFDQEITFADGRVLSTDTIYLEVLEDKTTPPPV